MLAVPGTAQTFGDRSEITHEELLEMTKTGLVVFAVPAALGYLHAYLLGIAVEPLDMTEITAMQLAPLRTERSEYPPRGAYDILMGGCH